MFYFKCAHSRNLQTFAAFLPKIADQDVTKTPFSQKFSQWISLKFGGRHQIDAGERTESFASISAAVFDLSRKVGWGGAFFAPPPSQAGVKRYSFVTWPVILKPKSIHVDVFF